MLVRTARAKLLPLAALAVVLIAVVGVMAWPNGRGLLGTAGSGYTLTVDRPEHGALRIQPYLPGFKTHVCGDTDTQTMNECTLTVQSGAAVMITAVPKTGAHFKGWGGTCGTGVPNYVSTRGTLCDVTMVNNYTASAVFSPFTVQILSGNNQSHHMGGWNGNDYGAAAFQPLSVKVLKYGVPISGASVHFSCNPPAGFPNVTCYLATNGPIATGSVNITTDANGIALQDRWNAKDRFGNWSRWLGAWVVNYSIMKNSCNGDSELQEPAPFTVTASHADTTATFNLSVAAGSYWMTCYG